MSDEENNERSTKKKEEKWAESLYFVQGLIKTVVTFLNTRQNNAALLKAWRILL
jgi:hypothetical protein